MSYLSSFIRLTWLSASACPVFVAVTECEFRVRTLRQAVTNFLATCLASTSVLCINYFRFHSVPEHSRFSSIPKHDGSSSHPISVHTHPSPGKLSSSESDNSQWMDAYTVEPHLTDTPEKQTHEKKSTLYTTDHTLLHHTLFIVL